MQSKSQRAAWLVEALKEFANRLAIRTNNGLYGEDEIRDTADKIILTLTHTAAELQKSEIEYTHAEVRDLILADARARCGLPDAKLELDNPDSLACTVVHRETSVCEEPKI